jgi:hypothetical protein
MEELAPEVRPSRRRISVAPIIGGLLAGAGIAIALLSREPQVEREFVPVVMPILMAQPPAEPVPLPAPTVATATCPAPRVDAPRMVHPKLPEKITNVVASLTNAGWLAAYTTDHLYVSRDAGATFERVLDEDGAIRDVVFDCFGRVAVIRGTRLGVLDGDRATWRTVPHFDLEDRRYSDNNDTEPPIVKLVGGGPAIGIVGHEGSTARVGITHDLGATWGYHTLHEWFESGNDIAAQQLPDGSFDVAIEITDCDWYYMIWMRIRGERVEKKQFPWAGSPLAFYGAMLTSSDYRRTWSAPLTFEGWTQIPSLRNEDDNQVGSFHGAALQAPYPVLVDANTPYRIVRGKPVAMRLHVAGDSPVMDPANRIWTVWCGAPRVATRDAPSDCE